MSHASSHFEKWSGNRRTFNSYLRNFRAELSLKKIFWTIQDDDVALARPTTSLTRIAAAEEGKALDHDYRLVERYERLTRARKEECEQAISILERSLGSVQLDRIDAILHSEEPPRRRILLGYNKLVALYGRSTSNLIDQIEEDFNALPAATSAEDVIHLLDKMLEFTAELRNSDRTTVWSSSQLNKFLNKRVKLTEFMACKDRCLLADAQWETTEDEFRLVAERAMLTSFSVRQEARTPIKTQSSKRVDGATVQEFTNSIAAALSNQNVNPRTCWNCNQVGHYVKECKLGLCRSCSNKGEKCNHNPSECPLYVPKSREKRSHDRSSTTITGAFKGQPFKANITAAVTDESDAKRVRGNDDEDDNKLSIWDQIRLGKADSDNDSNYSSAYLHPFTITISKETAKLICSTSFTLTNTSPATNYRVLLDSDASISLCD